MQIDGQFKVEKEFHSSTFYNSLWSTTRNGLILQISRCNNFRWLIVEYSYWWNQQQSKKNCWPPVLSVFYAFISSNTSSVICATCTTSSQVATLHKSGILTLSSIWVNWNKYRNLHSKCASKVGVAIVANTYPDLLHLSNLPSLADRRKSLNLCYFSKLVNNAINFPKSLLIPRTLNYPIRQGRTSLFVQPFAISNSLQKLYSFFPSTISHWDSLPQSINDMSFSSLCLFKRSLCTLLTNINS